MTEQHYDETTLIDVAIGEAELPLVREVEQHAAECRACSEALGALREFATELRNADNWRNEEPRFPSSREVDVAMQPVVDAARRLSDEEREAAEWLATRRGPAPQTAGMVRLLLVTARDKFDHDPAAAVSDAGNAISIADVLPDAYPGVLRAELRASARREAANALRLLGRFEESLQRLDEAAKVLEPFPSAGFQRACIQYVRGTVLWQLHHPAEALAAAEECAETFVIYGDVKRAAHAAILAGGISFERGDTAKARDLFMEQIRPLQNLGDTRNLANVFNNIGHCNVVLGDRESAATFFLQALRLFDELGYATSKAHVQWGLARLLLADGKSADAIARLEQAESDFSRLQMRTQEGLVGLELVELRLALGQSAGIAARCRDLLAIFRGAGLPDNANAALAYLQEAVQNERVDIPTVQHVRLYLEALPTTPQLLFAPPPECSQP